MTLAMIGWVAYLAFFGLALPLVIVWDDEDSEGTEAGSYFSWFLGLIVLVVIVLPISFGLRYDIYGDLASYGRYDLLKLSGYVALAVASVGFIVAFVQRRRKQNETGAEEQRDVANQSSGQNSRSSDLTIVHVVELTSAVVGLVAAILSIVAIYRAN